MQTQNIKILRNIRNQSLKGIKEHSLISFFRLFNPINYQICISGAFKMHCLCIGSALAVHFKSSLNAFKKDCRCIKNINPLVSGILNGLIHKFAIFLGRQPP